MSDCKSNGALYVPSGLHGGRGAAFLFMLVFSGWLLSLGCDQPQVRSPIADPVAEEPVIGPVVSQEAAPVEETPATAPAGFGVSRIGILPLTQLVPRKADGQTASLTIYVSFLDAFGCQIKAPGVLRFELYRYVPRSARPMGERITIWPDIDLTRPSDNNAYWRDHLRAYEFRLDAPAGLVDTCILEATCIGSDGRRFTAEFPLRAGQ